MRNELEPAFSHVQNALAISSVTLAHISHAHLRARACTNFDPTPNVRALPLEQVPLGDEEAGRGNREIANASVRYEAGSNVSIS